MIFQKQTLTSIDNRIDWATIGEHAVDIASDLIFSLPDLAIEIVDRATRSSMKSVPQDWAFFRLSLAVTRAEPEIRTPNTLEMIRERITDPKTRHLSAAISALVENYSADQIMAEAKGLESNEEQLLLLRGWTLKNREKEDAIHVVEYAYDISLRSTSLTITAKDLREIAAPLPFAKDLIRAKRIVGLLDSQKSAVQRLSTSTDYVRLQLVLAHAESKYHFESAANRIAEVYLYYIMNIEDVRLKSECLARVVAALSEIDPDKRLEIDGNLHSLVEEDLNHNINELLSNSAEQYRVAEGIIKALAKSRTDLAIKIAKSLNVEPRRDMAYSEIVSAHLKRTLEQIDFSLVDDIRGLIRSKPLRDEILVNILDRLDNDRIDDTLIDHALRYIQDVTEIDGGADRANAYCSLYNILVRKEDSKHIDHAEEIFVPNPNSWTQPIMRNYTPAKGFNHE